MNSEPPKSRFIQGVLDELAAQQQGSAKPTAPRPPPPLTKLQRAEQELLEMERKILETKRDHEANNVLQMRIEEAEREERLEAERWEGRR